jgi:heptosyltransferase-2
MAERYLIVQLADIGDLILSTPALAALREARPDAHIALLTTAHSAPVIEGVGLADEIIMLDRRQFNSSTALFRPANLRRLLALRKGRYHMVMYFHHFTLRLGTVKFALIAWCAGAKRRIGLDNGNGWFLTERLFDAGFGAKHEAQHWLVLVGLLGADTSARPAKIGIDISRGGSQTLPHKADGHSRVVIHAGSGGYSKARRWDAEKFAQVADRLHEELDAQIVLVGTADDDGARVRAAMRAEPVDLIGKTTLRELAGVMQASDLFIGADSG